MESSTGLWTTVGGGFRNQANGLQSATIAGGFANISGANSSTVGGGAGNQAAGDFSTIAGGYANLNLGEGGFIGGGGSDGINFSGNTVEGAVSVVVGGMANDNLGDYAVIVGGIGNTNFGEVASIGGGLANSIQPDAACAVISDGSNNIAAGVFSFAAGQQAQALHPGAFVWADLQNAPFASTANDQFSVRARGGGVFASGSNTANQTVSWTPGAGGWNFASDRNLKDHVVPVDEVSVLAKVAQLPLAEWRYRGFDQRHIGAMAQDFHALFPFNDNDRVLNEADLHGVELAAIKGLNQKLNEKKCRTPRLEGEAG